MVTGIHFKTIVNNTIKKLLIHSLFFGKLMLDIKTVTQQQQLMIYFQSKQRNKYRMLVM
jgi:hypothetical protein